MTRTLRIIAALSLLLCLTYGQQHVLSGFTSWNTITDNSSQCLLFVNGDLVANSDSDPTLKYQVHQASRAGVNQSAQALAENCSYHNYHPDSFFYGDKFDANNVFLVWQNDSNSDFIVDSTLFPSAIQSTNGSTCVWLPQIDAPEVQQYVCKTFFDTTPVDLVIWATGNLSFVNSTPTNSLLFAEDVLNTRLVVGQASTLSLNSSFPDIVVALYDACSSTNITIPSLSTGVTVTASVDLSANLAGMQLAWTLIRQNNTKDYLSVQSNSSVPLFTLPSPSGCWWLGVNYSDILPDQEYCSQGCSVSFVLTDTRSRIYTLKTYGLWVAHAGNATGNATNGTSGSVSGTGSVSGNVGGVSGQGSGSGTVSGSVSSATTMVFNACLLLISFAYLAWL